VKKDRIVPRVLPCGFCAAGPDEDHTKECVDTRMAALQQAAKEAVEAQVVLDLWIPRSNVLSEVEADRAGVDLRVVETLAKMDECLSRVMEVEREELLASWSVPKPPPRGERIESQSPRTIKSVW
jgi:hypothetical protein